MHRLPNHYYCHWDHLTVKRILMRGVRFVSKFFESWKIRLNMNKTEFIVFSKSTLMLNRAEADQIVLDNYRFNWKPVVTYLGMDLDRKLLFRNHIEKVVKKAETLAYKNFYCLLKRRSNVPIDTKINIYRSIIRPVLTYACPVYCNCANRHLNKIQICQNKILRMILDSPLYTTNLEIHSLAKIPTIREFISKLTDNFYSRVTNHENPYVSNLGNYDYNNLPFRVKHRLPKPA